MMALVHLLRLPSTLNSLLVLVLNIVIALDVLWQVARLWQRLDAPTSTTLPLALPSIVISVDLARWSTIGLETPLFTALFFAVNSPVFANGYYQWVFAF